MDTNFYSILIILLLGMILIILSFTFWKVRQIHLTSFDVTSNVNNIRIETDNLFSQIQALLALERLLSLTEALPPLRGWAGSPDFLLNVAHKVLDNKPSTVMECSSGVSTLTVARCLQINGSGHVYSLEHDPIYAEKTRKLLDKHGLSEFATVLDAPLQNKHTDTPWYSEDVIPDNLAPVEMLIVDGPPTSVGYLARYPALPRLITRMAERFSVFVDDADRPDETEMVRRWQELYPNLELRNGYCEKGLMILESQIQSDK